MNPGQITETRLDDKNECYICDVKFGDLELHFLNVHTSQTTVDKKEGLAEDDYGNEGIIETESRINQHSTNIQIFNDDSLDYIRGSKETTNAEEIDLHQNNKAYLPKKDEDKNTNIEDTNETSIDSLKNSEEKVKTTANNGHKNHNCKSCGKSFSRAGSLKEHMRTVHEGLKDHKCDSVVNVFLKQDT